MNIKSLIYKRLQFHNTFLKRIMVIILVLVISLVISYIKWKMKLRNMESKFRGEAFQLKREKRRNFLISPIT